MSEREQIDELRKREAVMLDALTKANNVIQIHKHLHPSLEAEASVLNSKLTGLLTDMKIPDIGK